MMPRILTCCYCGTRAALVLDRGRHELVCASCGAPLHQIKQMPLTPQTPARPEAKPAPKKAKKRKAKPKKRRFSKILDEIWDEIEDIFD